MNDRQDSRGAIGNEQGRTGTGTGTGNITYGVMPEQALKDLQNKPGADFIVIQRVHQSEEPTVWASGDPTQTQALFRDAYTSLAFDKEPVG